MAGPNVAYIISDNFVSERQPRDHYIALGQIFLETYFAKPLGTYEIQYVNNFQQVLELVLFAPAD